MASALWRHREFLKFWAGSGISDVGSQVTALRVQPKTRAAGPGRVGHVVNATREAVDGVDRLPLRPGERDESPVEVRGIAAREVAARLESGEEAVGI